MPGPSQACRGEELEIAGRPAPVLMPCRNVHLTCLPLRTARLEVTGSRSRASGGRRESSQIFIGPALPGCRGDRGLGAGAAGRSVCTTYGWAIGPGPETGTTFVLPAPCRTAALPRLRLHHGRLHADRGGSQPRLQGFLVCDRDRSLGGPTCSPYLRVRIGTEAAPARAGDLWIKTKTSPLGLISGPDLPA